MNAFELSIEENFELQKQFLAIDNAKDIEQLKDLFKQSLKMSRLREKYFRSLIEKSKSF